MNCVKPRSNISSSYTFNSQLVWWEISNTVTFQVQSHIFKFLLHLGRFFFLHLYDDFFNIYWKVFKFKSMTLIFLFFSFFKQFKQNSLELVELSPIFIFVQRTDVDHTDMKVQICSFWYHYHNILIVIHHTLFWIKIIIQLIRQHILQTHSWQ